MILGVLKEPSFESRVSLVAETAAALIKKGVSVWVETAAGSGAACADEEYRKSGAIIKSRREVVESAEIILTIHPPQGAEVASLKSKILIGVYQPLYVADKMEEWATEQITTFSMDMLPRTTRA